MRNQPSQRLSPAARQLIETLLNIDQRKRPAGEQIRAHPFFEDVVWDNVLNSKKIPHNRSRSQTGSRTQSSADNSPGVCMCPLERVFESLFIF